MAGAISRGVQSHKNRAYDIIKFKVRKNEEKEI